MSEKLTFEEILADPENMKCLCHHDGTHPPIPKCEHRTFCSECVIVHRLEGTPPSCFAGWTDLKVLPPPDMERRYGPDGKVKWLADPENKKCVCTQEFDGKPCAYRGRCRECLSIHRYYKSYAACTPDFPGRGDLRHDLPAE